MRRPKQLKLIDVMPNYIVIIETAGKTVDAIVEAMMAVPMDKSILLDFLQGYQYRGEDRREWLAEHPLTDDQRELYRLQMLLNSRYRGQRFNWFGNDMIATMARESIAKELWRPKQ